VTSAVIPIPAGWNRLAKVRVAVSVDGLPEDHDARRRPATYEKILRNIAGRRVDISWVVTRPMVQRPGYLDEYLAFWTARPEIDRIWLNVYTPQIGERSPEMLDRQDRRRLVQQLTGLKQKYPQLLMSEGIAGAFETPPAGPDQCTFAQMSVNYSADLKTRIEPCFYGGEPDCSQCGCAVTAGLHWIGNKSMLGPLRVSHIMKSSIAVGSLVNRIRTQSAEGIRWGSPRQTSGNGDGLVQIRQS
jgi:hypothetical protein